jgi:hypothetical protein
MVSPEGKPLPGQNVAVASENRSFTPLRVLNNNNNVVCFITDSRVS